MRTGSCFHLGLFGLYIVGLDIRLLLWVWVHDTGIFKDVASSSSLDDLQNVKGCLLSLFSCSRFEGWSVSVGWDIYLPYLHTTVQLDLILAVWALTLVDNNVDQAYFYHSALYNNKHHVTLLSTVACHYQTIICTNWMGKECTEVDFHCAELISCNSKSLNGHDNYQTLKSSLWDHREIIYSIFSVYDCIFFFEVGLNQV